MVSLLYHPQITHYFHPGCWTPRMAWACSWWGRWVQYLDLVAKKVTNGLLEALSDLGVSHFYSFCYRRVRTALEYLKPRFLLDMLPDITLCLSLEAYPELMAGCCIWFVPIGVRFSQEGDLENLWGEASSRKPYLMIHYELQDVLGWWYISSL